MINKCIFYFWLLIYIFSTLICLVGLITQAWAGSAIQINLPAESKVDGETILLQHIAQIQGPDTKTSQRLKTINMGSAPVPGHWFWVHRSQVETKLRHNGFDPANFRIQGAVSVKVWRSHAEVTASRICNVVKAYIQKHAPWDRDQMKIRYVKYGQSIKVPKGKLTLQVTTPKHMDWLGSVPFGVRILVNGQAIKKVGVPAYIEVWTNVVTTTKPLGKYQPIKRTDIKLQKVNLTRTPANVIMRLDQVLGCRTNRAIAANSVLRSDQVELPPLVRKGDVVQILAESKYLRISTKGKAKQSGSRGEQIKVVNLQSKRIVYAQVVDAQTVKVEF